MAVPRRYFSHGSAATGTNLTIVTMVSAATVRPGLYDIMIGSVATPADQAIRWQVLRFTAAGTAGSAFTPQAIDPSDPAALASSGAGAFTVEPTFTANSQVLAISMNQRATYRWSANPGSELQAPATAANGLGVRSISGTGTAAFEVGIHWFE